MSNDPPTEPYGPWNPGIKSQLPTALLPLVTLFQPENGLVSAEEARELADLTGLKIFDLATFKPERLAVHELLVRVTADFSVPDGPKYEDLGISFRQIAGTILSDYIEPQRDTLSRTYEDLRWRAERFVEDELIQSFMGKAKTNEDRSGWFAFFRKNKPAAKAPAEAAQNFLSADDTGPALARWQEALSATNDPLARCAYGALIRIVTAISSQHGRLRMDKALLTRIVANRICNDYGGDLIGQIIDPLIRKAAEQENFRLLPVQSRPVVMNVKGASASGKSTLRPLQRNLAEKIGVAWEDFAVISPDIWRKFLLDYDSLGDAYKYAGTLTGHEIELIDQKLDRYMSGKARHGTMSHLLIDRFRFDSFAPEPDAEEGSNLMTRFGDEIYMFFMITPPEATVERAWYRGLEFGRYKAVDDLLDHNVEAFTGMPRLFFTWALRADKSVHFEFLDNSVDKGQQPRTVAFGRNDDMTVFDIKSLLHINQYQKINIDALCPEDVYPDADLLSVEANLTFLKQCSQRIATLTFADQTTGNPYARMEKGKLVWINPVGFGAALADDDTSAVLTALDPQAEELLTTPLDEPPPDSPVATHTLGQWGTTGNDGPV